MICRTCGETPRPWRWSRTRQNLPMHSVVGDAKRAALARALDRLPYIESVTVDGDSGYVGEVTVTIHGDAHIPVRRPDPNPFPAFRFLRRTP